jgi:hypothetical protein
MLLVYTALFIASHMLVFLLIFPFYCYFDFFLNIVHAVLYVGAVYDFWKSDATTSDDVSCFMGYFTASFKLNSLYVSSGRVIASHELQRSGHGLF